LFGVRAMDPLVVASVAIILAVVSFLAVSIPARRASRVNPVIALAGE
jgi:ABC-type antimicrobial peptide transport system permease subunit